MCRSKGKGGRRCTGSHATTASKQSAPPPPVSTPPPAETSSAETVAPAPATTGIGRPMTRRQFLATPVTELASIEPGGIIRVQPKPAGTSEDTYRDHLASGPRMNVRVRPADTEGLPERLWGGSMARGCDPETARVIANKALQRGELVSVEWTDPPARKPLGTKEGRQVATDAWRLDRLAGDLAEAQRTGDDAGVLRARMELDRLNAQIAAGYGDGTTEGTR